MSLHTSLSTIIRNDGALSITPKPMLPLSTSDQQNSRRKATEDARKQAAEEEAGKQAGDKLKPAQNNATKPGEVTTEEEEEEEEDGEDGEDGEEEDEDDIDVGDILIDLEDQVSDIIAQIRKLRVRIIRTNSLPFCSTIIPQPLKDLRTESQRPQETQDNPLNLILPTKRLVVAMDGLWPVGSVIRVRFLDKNDEMEALVRQYAPIWTQYANLNFEFVNGGDAEIRISFNANGGMFTTGLGDYGQLRGDGPTMNIDPSWKLSSGLDSVQQSIVHEFGHALGCYHELLNPKANIQWKMDVLRQRYAGNSGGLWQIYRENGISNTDSSEFDRSSVMMYDLSSDLAYTDIHMIHVPGYLSEMDKKFISSIYPGRDGGVIGGGGNPVLNWNQDLEDWGGLNPGWTWLHVYSQQGNVDMVNNGLDAGADPNRHESRNGSTPLHIATLYEHVPVIQVLLSRGADRTALSYDSNLTALDYAIGKNNPALIAALS